MKKIILASLLSVSLLGASTAAFADDKATTTGDVEVTGGALKLTKNTASLSFGDVTVQQLLGADSSVPTTATGTGLSEEVQDLTGSDKGWVLGANFAGLYARGDADKKIVSQATLSIDGTPLAATGADVKKTTDGKLTGKTDASKIVMNVPKTTQVGKYSGDINWTLTAGPDNGVAATTTNVAPAAE
ncbi:hypothetical protein [Weissella cibaria]|uniref:hypothetical protein n=1 Tax=Weissella cibaria TaxID=137591 RepID=UPI0021D51DBE|nr:hypothetical protein [Weissella cibaria]MCU7538185.1 hypothetical protein [Weissella cibaria]